MSGKKNNYFKRFITFYTKKGYCRNDFNGIEKLKTTYIMTNYKQKHKIFSRV